jgi:hypothetical protein
LIILIILEEYSNETSDYEVSSNLSTISLRVNILLSTLFSNTFSLCSHIISSFKFHTRTEPQPNYSPAHSTFYILDRRREDKRFCTEWEQTFPEFNLLLISS